MGNETIDKKLNDYYKDLNEINNISEKQITLESKLEIIKDVISNSACIDEFDADVFEALIKNVVVGGYNEDGTKEPHMITFVFSDNRMTPNLDMNYTVVDSFNVDVNFYDFNKNDKGILKRLLINSVPVRIAIENE